MRENVIVGRVKSYFIPYNMLQYNVNNSPNIDFMLVGVLRFNLFYPVQCLINRYSKQNCPSIWMENDKKNALNKYKYVVNYWVAWFTTLIDYQLLLSFQHEFAKSKRINRTRWYKRNRSTNLIWNPMEINVKLKWDKNINKEKLRCLFLLWQRPNEFAS